MDTMESLVARFLAHNSFFLSPQYDLRDAGDWKASIDFLVLDFDNRHVVAVEVADAGGLGSVGKKAGVFVSEDYFGRVSRQVTLQTRGLTEGWPVLFLGFVRDEALVNEAYSKFPDRRFFFRRMRDTIEDYWKIRDQSLLPQRPVSSV